MNFNLNPIEKPVLISDEHLRLNGILGLPKNARGIILFAHGSGSGRFSSRNHFVARELQKIGLATLLMDLLTGDEETDRRNVFDIELLAKRVLFAKKWIQSTPEIKSLPIGYFGASTGAGAALVAAAHRPDQVFALVSRGGRPDLAKGALLKVKCPTQLIVGGRDNGVIDLNEESYRKLKCEKSLKIVPGATHLFEEPGTLELVAYHAGKWFKDHLPKTIPGMVQAEQWF